ncbi:MAG: HDOD domain-containing protein [Chromatiales bacterium]|nr:HDOD domain-containing protein [Gammaproteobacteria bacterium]MBW6477060.1 HDOD domain-containing protein [Chromatiales bacterium]
MTQVVHSALETRLEVLKLNELPAMSVVAQQFLRAIEEPDCQIAQLAEIVEQDPAILARLIGVANSAYFSPIEPVTTAHDAIFKVLGLNTSKSLVLAIILSGPFDLSRCPSFPIRDFWLESVFAATLAQAMAPLLKVQPKPLHGSPYLAGLLLRIGLLAMVHVYPQEMGEVLASLREQVICDPQKLQELEQVAMGVDHAEVGAWLVRKWHLPGVIGVVMEHHLDPAYRGEHWPLVVLTEFCARWSATAVRGGREEDYPSLSELRVLGVDIAQAGTKLGTVALRLDELRGLAGAFAGTGHG